MSDTRRRSSTLVITPTYNEVESVAAHVRAVRASAPGVDVLLVDDSSPDGTGVVADGLATADPAVHVLHRPVREGLGPAYVAGFAWAMERGYDLVVEMDADGSHAAGDLPRLLAASRVSDVVIGSRWVAGGVVRRWPLSREALSRLGNRYTRALLRVPLHDLTSGLRVYRTEVLRTMRYADLSSHGYSFQVEGAWRALQSGATVREVPITFTERRLGSSKMGPGIVFEAARRVTVWGVGMRMAGLAPHRARAAVPRAREA